MNKLLGEMIVRSLLHLCCLTFRKGLIGSMPQIYVTSPGRFFALFYYFGEEKYLQGVISVDLFVFLYYVQMAIFLLF